MSKAALSGAIVSDNRSLTASPIQLIYAGGTFGSYGKPLTTLSAPVFTPLLIDYIHKDMTTQVSILDNTCIKDSSQLSPQDFVHFYALILSNYSPSTRRFVLLTGTDTLSYLGAFLAEAFAGTDICIILTASMRPLFAPDNINSYVINEHSDALGNLTDTIGLASYGESGVYVAFGGESWPAQTVQKVHSHDLMAFTGHSRAGYPANSYVKALPKGRFDNWMEDTQKQLPQIKSAVTKVVIPTLYLVPNALDWLAIQLQSLMSQPATGIILIGFGAGNLPYNEQIAATMDALYKQGHLLVTTTQCPYGGVSEAYAAGSWQYDHHVLSAGRLTIPAVYARLLWLHLKYDTPARRRQRWTYSVGKTHIGLSK